MKFKGFTLIELLFVMILFATLTVLSVVTSSYFTARNEQQTLTDEIKNLVQYAKIQAVALGTTINIEPLDSSFDWSKGIKLTKFNKTIKQDQVLYQYQWHHRHWHVTWSGIHSPNKIIVSNNPITAISNGHFELYNIQTKVNVILILNRLGRVRIKET